LLALLYELFQRKHIGRKHPRRKLVELIRGVVGNVVPKLRVEVVDAPHPAARRIALCNQKNVRYIYFEFVEINAEN
jgi:hypothetical protein